MAAHDGVGGLGDCLDRTRGEIQMDPAVVGGRRLSSDGNLFRPAGALETATRAGRRLPGWAEVANDKPYEKFGAASESVGRVTIFIIGLAIRWESSAKGRSNFEDQSLCSEGPAVVALVAVVWSYPSDYLFGGPETCHPFDDRNGIIDRSRSVLLRVWFR